MSSLSHNTTNDGVDNEVLRLVEAVCYSGLIPLLCVISVPANVLNCLVFWRQGLQERMNLCLLCLALVDSLYAGCSFALYSVNVFIRFHDEIVSEEYSAKIFVYLRGAIYGFRTTSQCITMVIAVERCLCVVYPLQAARLLKTRTMGTIMLCFFILFHGGYLLLPFSYQVIHTTGQGGTTHWNVVLTQFFVHNEVLIIALVYSFIETVVPFVLLLTICVSTLITVV